MAKKRFRLKKADTKLSKEEIKRSLERWKKVPLITTKPKQCKYCSISFITPCNENEYTLCENYLVIKKQKRVRLKKGR